jgi:hypothetical protein
MWCSKQPLMRDVNIPRIGQLSQIRQNIFKPQAPSPFHDTSPSTFIPINVNQASIE